MSNAVVEYLKNAFDGRNLEADAQKLEMPIEKLKSLIEEGALISAQFAKTLEEKINSIRASELLDAQVTQAKAEAKAAGKVDTVAQEVRAEKPADVTPAPMRQGRTGQSSSVPSFQRTQSVRSRTIY